MGFFMILYPTTILFRVTHAIEQTVGDLIAGKQLLSKDIKIAGNDIVTCVKSKKPLCVYEAFHKIIFEAHIAVSHGGREKTYSEISSQYSWLPRFCVEIFLKQCLPCQTRKPIKHHVVSKPIISLGIMTRLQIDLIDMRTRPDKISPEIVYCWILNCIDHFSKFSWAYPLKNKTAAEVVTKLYELFFVFGPPHIIHSDNGREFVSSVTMELKNSFHDLLFIRGRPRHPQSQGCIERANGVLCDALGKWMSTNNSSSWSTALLPVTYGINTRKSTVTKATPYEIMFGQRPRSDSDFWKLVQEAGIEDEENLPIPVDESNDNMIDDALDNPIDINAHIDTEVVELLKQLSDDMSSYSSTSSSSKLPNSSTALTSSATVATTPTRHDKIRKTATDHYLATANKKMKLHQDSLNMIANNFNINDCVGLEIHPVDRTNTDPKYLPCRIVEKTAKNNVFLYKLICQYGVLQKSFEVGQFVNLNDACPDELKKINADNLKPITLIEASKLYARGSVTGRTCNCRSKCSTKTCPCKKVNMPHKKLPSDTYHSIGYAENEQHLGKPKVSENKEVAGRQAGLGGEKGSQICGQSGPELLGGKVFIN
ncbi:unnamed protein product [Rotaria sp. Silwood2]|nr:unnamed protein product [Rotaria sp. Silwood2]CAF3118501.1 unnamed protein product [Rotaria sp. Silwood2]CAF3886796.1 unnamed protein product [Rotaria sp. Silwood2]CAF4126450.1 unnamed protein product [Rotaria sp. Silwood2]CAF4272716.1 unnamed protein product [Rotaria sp. Silwood2]